MVILFIIGFICLLLVMGYFFSENPVQFAIKGIVITGAVAFVAVILFFASIILPSILK